MSRPGLLLAACFAACFFVACSDGNARFDVRASVGQIYVTHAPPSLALAVVDGKGARAATGTTDALGSLVFRNLAPGTYTVRTTEPRPSQVSRHVDVLTVAESQP